MKTGILALLLTAGLLAQPASAQLKKQERKSLLDSDPEVVYLEQALPKPVELKVVKEASVFTDKDGKNRLGTLKADQMVKLEAITERSYRVRGQGTRGGISGWVSPAAFSSKDPDFVVHLKQLYERQMAVQKLIEEKMVAVGMTMDEVSQSRGKPTKTSVRKTASGESGSWEYIDYEDVKNYANEIDPRTGQVYKRLISVTRVEKGKTRVEFADNLVTALEESENHEGGDVKIIVPPVVWRWW